MKNKCQKKSHCLQPTLPTVSSLRCMPVACSHHHQLLQGWLPKVQGRSKKLQTSKSDFMFATFYKSTQTAQASGHTTSIILSCNKIQNGDILVPANKGPPGKRPIPIHMLLSPSYAHRLLFLLECDEIWYAEANFDPIDGNVRKIQKFPNSRWRPSAMLDLLWRHHIVQEDWV